MATRVVEWKKPYTWWKAISIDENKVISLNLRDENNLIIYDEWDDEIYVDLQLDDEITPTDAFPIWVNVGRVIVDNGWDLPWTIISAVTTSWDNIKIFYADVWTLWIDNGTWTFKQIYFKADIDALLLALRNYIDWELAKKQNWVSSDTAPSNPNEWDLWYDTINDELKVYDGSQWTWVWWWDVLVSDQANNIFTPWMKIWGWTESDYQSLTPDSNTAYLLLANQPAPPSPRQPWVNTKVYYKINDNDTNSTIYDLSWNWVDQTWNWTPWYTTDATYGRVAVFDGNSYTQAGSIVNLWSECTLIALVKRASGYTVVAEWASRSDYSSVCLNFNRDYDKYTWWYAWAWASEPKQVDSISATVSNQWVMIATTRASDWTAKIYVNGVLDNTVTWMNNPNYSSWENLQLGRWRNGDEKYLNWQIKLIIWEDRTWTDQEISDLASEYGF